MRRLAGLLAAACATACVHTVELSSAIGPSASAEGRSAEKAGVVCGTDLLDHVERARAGLATTWRFDLGQPLCGLLVKSVESSHRAAHRAMMMPLAGQYGRVVRFDLQNSALSIERQPNGEMRVAYTISVVVERFGRELERLGTSRVSANKLVDCPEVTDEIVQQTVESALQEIADDASSLLVARIDGPRVQPARSSR
jgi:hypothetical protein